MSPDGPPWRPAAEPMPVSIYGQIVGIERELANMRNSFPAWVAAGKIAAARADYRLAVMAAALRSLKRLARCMEERSKAAKNGRERANVRV